MNSKSKWKIGSAIIIFCFAAAIYFVSWYFWTGSPKEIIAVADQFKANPSWHLKSEHVEPPRNACIDIECPSVRRAWTTKDSLTLDELMNIVEASGWNLAVDNSCSNNVNLKRLHCSASGSIDKYFVTLYADTNNNQERSDVNLYITQR